MITSFISRRDTSLCWYSRTGDDIDVDDRAHVTSLPNNSGSIKSTTLPAVTAAVTASQDSWMALALAGIVEVGVKHTR